MNYRHVAAGSLLFALVFASLASGGFSASELNREADISVADHGEALIDVSAETDVTPIYKNGTIVDTIEQTDVTVTNQFGHDLTIDQVGGDDIDEELPIHGTEMWTIDGCPQRVTIHIHATRIVFFATITVEVDGNCQP